MKYIKTFESYKTTNEGYMSELDIIRQESKTVDEFIKNAKKEFPEIAKMKEADVFLHDLWRLSQDIKEGFVKNYGQQMKQDDFEKLPVGAKVLYKGTQFTIGENNGATVILNPVKPGNPVMVNLNMFNQGGAITESFLNEGHLDFKVQKVLQLGGVTFELDEERTEEDDDNRFDYVQVYYADEKSNGNEWIIKVGTTSKRTYILEIIEDEKVVFTHEYPSSQKAFFDQDCANSLGFIPELD